MEIKCGRSHGIFYGRENHAGFAALKDNPGAESGWRLSQLESLGWASHTAFAFLQI